MGIRALDREKRKHKDAYKQRENQQKKENDRLFRKYTADLMAENIYYPSYYIRQWLKNRGLSQASLYSYIKMDSNRIDLMMEGKLPLSKKMAEGVHKLLGVDTIWLLAIQRVWDKKGSRGVNK